MEKEGKTPEALRRLATSTGKASAPADNRRVSENSAASRLDTGRQQNRGTLPKALTRLVAIGP